MKGIVVSLVLLLVLTAAAPAGAEFNYSGALYLAGTGDAELYYAVRELSYGKWLYQYCAVTDGWDPSHIIVGVTPGSEEEDFFGSSLEFEGPRWFTPLEPSNPGLPADLFGIKGEGEFINCVSWCFESTHEPVWGNAYIKGGWNPCEEEWLYSYTPGFFEPYPLVGAHSGPEGGFALVPDGTCAVPVPGAVLLGSIGLATVSWFRRKLS